jgi:hypothetical protein
MSFVLTYVLAILAAVIILWRHRPEARRRRAQARRNEPATSVKRSLLVAFFTVVIALPAGGIVGYAVMFGPSHLTGDFIGLPWLTMLPALAAGGWTFAKVSKKISDRVNQRAS